MMPEIRDEVLEVIRAPYIFPGDIIDAIKGDLRAWENYQRLGDGYRRIRVAYIDAARKRPEEFRKRLENFILTTREGRLIKGFGGIERYYGGEGVGELGLILKRIKKWYNGICCV